MTPQPTQKITLPPHVKRRRVLRRRVTRPVTPATPPTRPYTGAELAALFKDRKPDPYNDVIMGHIEAARATEKQKALDDGLPWD